MLHRFTPFVLVAVVLGVYVLAAWLDARAEQELFERQDAAAWKEQQQRREARRIWCRKHQSICAPAEYQPLR